MKKLLILLFLLLPLQAFAAPTFDAGGGGGNDFGTSVSFSHTTGGGADRIMFACVNIAFDPAGTVVTAPTYNSVSFTLVDSTSGPDSKTYLYRLLAPASGSNTFAVTTNQNDAIAVAVATYSGVNQTTPLGTPVNASPGGNSTSINVSSAAGEVVIDCFGLDNVNHDTVNIGAGQTQRAYGFASDIPADERFQTRISEEAGAASVTMSWSWTNGQANDIVGVGVKPAAAGTKRRSQTIVIQ